MITLEQSTLEVVRALPPEKQQEILEHAEKLRRPSKILDAPVERQGPLGGFAHHADRRRD